ncbi:MAG: hypothetical protein GDA48_03345 [Hormoscilla sp. GM102CHS1]|nr:hypothetical protein [Hormoscilla sp. GM102CHS1]
MHSSFKNPNTTTFSHRLSQCCGIDNPDSDRGNGVFAIVGRTMALYGAISERFWLRSVSQILLMI